MNSLSTDILKAWQDYVITSGMEKSRIPASAVHEHQQFFINNTNCEDMQNGSNITLPKAMGAHYLNHYVKKDDEGNITAFEPLNILFPILRCTETERGKSVVKYLPLFAYSLPKTFFEGECSRIFMPVKDGQQVLALNAVFRDVFDLDLPELGEDRHMMSIVSALNSAKYDDFTQALDGLIHWVQSRLGNKQNIVLETGFNALIAPLHNEDFNTQRDAKDFKWLSDKPVGDFPLLEQYLTACQTEEQNHSADGAIYGLFEHEYPLGHGQMLAIQAINEQEKLVAVQGAPGTGKTTLFKSLIAQQIVEKALAIIDNQDRNLGMVVTSTAIKAVENIIDDLRKDPLTQDLDWLWFHSGSKGQIQKELSRVERLMACWQQHDHDAVEQAGYQQTLIMGRQEINDCLARFHHLRTLSRQALDVCDPTADSIDQLPAEMETHWDTLTDAASNAGLNLLGRKAQHITALLGDIATQQLAFEQQRNKRAAAQQQAKALEAVWPVNHSWQQIHHWMNADLRQPIESQYSHYPTSGLSAILVRIFSKKYDLQREKIRYFYPEDFTQLGLGALSHPEIAELAQAAAKHFSDPQLMEQLDHLAQPEPNAQPEIQLNELKALAEDVQRRLDLMIKAQQAEATLQQQFPEGNSSDILRKRFIRTHRTLFEAAIGFMWQQQLKQKKLLTEVMTHWKALIGGVQSAGYYRWLDKLDLFFTSLSLVYPVMATTLVSAYKTAGYSKLEELKGHKPWNLVLCDEAGMISVESLVPLLCRSEKAMIVGDPLQIEPIRNISEGTQKRLREKYFAQRNTLYEQVSPVSVTAYHRAAGCLSGLVTDKGNGIILDEHRRCQPPIAKLFSQLAGYQGISIETGATEARIAAAFDNMGKHHLMFYSVDGKKGAAVNTNMDEVDAIEQLLDKLEEAGYDLHKDIGIVTPYANQKTLLIQRVGDRLNHRASLAIGTVHQFQGVGFEVIIYSPVIFHPADATYFQNNAPNMLNVVVSRAKQQFIVVGNYYRLREAGSFLKTMAETVAEDFLLEQGSQNPAFESLIQRPSLKRYYRNCEHIGAFTAHAATCEKELIVITPWIRNSQSSQPQPQLEILAAAQQRGIHVKIYYGYYHINLSHKENEDLSLLAQYRERLGTDNVIRLTEGTHEKVLMVDGHLVTLGSWNWLSHSYHRECQKGTNFRNAIRHEVSAELEDPTFVAEWKARLNA